MIKIVTKPKVGGGGGRRGWGGKQFTSKNVEFLLCILLLTEGFLYCQRNLWLGDHIDTGCD